MPHAEPTVRVVIADDAVAIRHLLRAVLTRGGGFEVVGEAVDGAAAVSLAEELAPDAVVLDLAMPQMDGLAAIPEIRRRAPSTKICVVSSFPRATMEDRALALGAHAYVEKLEASGMVRDVLRRLCLQG